MKYAKKKKPGSKINVTCYNNLPVIEYPHLIHTLHIVKKQQVKNFTLAFFNLL